YFRFEYSPDNNEIKVSFRPEKRYITTTYNLRLGRISVEGHSKETKDAEHWEEMHKQVLVKLYDDLTEICKDNPYANKVTTPEEFEEALERTTRNTIVVTTARWCSPCGYFKNRRLSPFLKKNPHKYDVIFADMDPEFGKTVSDMGGYPIGSNEPLEEHFKKRCDDKGGSLPTVFFFDDKHKHLGTYKEGNDYRFNMNVEKLFGK
ncbi:hypothetical protein HOC35_06500, partial [Candidatus Woesearchaeota archaeon]|nr:hypothetical protein [Candidatus Woesearchaeota archaeon]